MKRITPFAVLTATTLLTACGGGGSGAGPVTIEEINNLGQKSVDIENALDSETIELQTQDALIAQGSARYEGYMIAGAEDTDDVFVGRTKIDVTFTNGGSLNGSVTDFVTLLDTTNEVTVDEDEEFVFVPLPTDTPLTAIDGSLTLTGGALGTETEGDFGVVDIDVSGSLTIPASVSFTEAEATYTVDGTLIGGVTSDDQFIAGGELNAVDGDTSFEVFSAIRAD